METVRDNKSVNRKRSKKLLSREVGLEIGSICGGYFFKLDHLHYGYWTSDLEVDLTNLYIAQRNFTKFLVSHIPGNTKTILDVGCGSGGVAKNLIDLDYKVDCVAPGPFLVRKVRELLGDQSNIYESYYEDVQTEKRYDLILFSESFQYINIEKSLEKTTEFLNDGGHMLICDVFKKDISEIAVQGGGHKLSKFYRLVENYPFRLIKDLDITSETAPNIDLVDDILTNVGKPVADSVFRLLESRYPLVLKLLKWRYRKKLDKINQKYFSSGRNGEQFRKFKSYRLLIYKKTVS